MTKNLPTKIANYAAVVFCALSCAGVIIGRDWRLLLVPLAIVPAMRLVVTFFTIEGPNAKPKGMLAVEVLSEVVQAGLSTALAYTLSASISNGRCPWAAGAMAAAMAALAVSSPCVGTSRYIVVRTVALLTTAVYYAVSAFASGGNVDIVSMGTAIGFLAFAVVRSGLAVRDWRKGGAT